MQLLLVDHCHFGRVWGTNSSGQRIGDDFCFVIGLGLVDGS